MVDAVLYGTAMFKDLTLPKIIIKRIILTNLKALGELIK